MFVGQALAADPNAEEGRLRWRPTRPVAHTDEYTTSPSSPTTRSVVVPSYSTIFGDETASKTTSAANRNATATAGDAKPNAEAKTSAGISSSRRQRPDMPRAIDTAVRPASDQSEPTPAPSELPSVRKPSRYVKQAVQLETRRNEPQPAAPVNTDLQLRGLEDDAPALAPRNIPPANNNNPLDALPPRQPQRIPLPDSDDPLGAPPARTQPRDLTPSRTVPRDLPPASRNAIDTPPPLSRPQPPVEPMDDGRADAKKDYCIQARKDCVDQFRRLKDHTLDQVSLDISVNASLRELKVDRPSYKMGNDFPCECVLGNETFSGRNWACTTFTWKASALCHKPLYFEDVAMERYGHSWGPVLDPFVSSVNFFGSLIFLPYKMGLETPNECVYALGYYRPGDCAPYSIDAIPLSPRGALFEAAGVVGLIYAIP